MQELRNATFCAVFPGNGWGHLEAPIIMGCIPVVVQDEILVPWENVLDFGSFGLRIPRAQLPRLPQILRAIPEERVRELQRGLVAVWEPNPNPNPNPDPSPNPNPNPSPSPNPNPNRDPDPYPDPNQVAVWERFTYSSVARAAASRRRCAPQGEEDSQSAEEGEGRVITEGCAPQEPAFVRG